MVYKGPYWLPELVCLGTLCSYKGIENCKVVQIVPGNVARERWVKCMKHVPDVVPTQIQIEFVHGLTMWTVEEDLDPPVEDGSPFCLDNCQCRQGLTMFKASKTEKDIACEPRWGAPA